MRLTKIFCTVVFLSLQLGCISQQSDNPYFAKQDQVLVDIYDKYYENRLDYGGTFGEARDTILIRFRETLQRTLTDKKSLEYPFDILADKIKIVSSKDNELRIFSWDELNGGTWHIYNSIFQYQRNDNYISENLEISKTDSNLPSYSDVAYINIDKLSDNEYLIKGYGTHGSGQDFYTFRKVSFENNKAKDCNGCFNGEDQLIFIKPRADKTSPMFNVKLGTISLPEYQLNENTGFLEKTGSNITLQYKNGNFIKTE